MLWKDFYDQRDEWYESVKPSDLIPTLEDMGTEEEISDILEDLSTDDAHLLYEKLVFFQVKLSPEETMHVMDYCNLTDEETDSFLRLQTDQGIDISKAEYLDFSNYINNEAAQVFLTRYCISKGMRFHSSDISEAMDCYPKSVISVMTDHAMNNQETFSKRMMETFCDFFYGDPYLFKICQYSLDHGMTLSGKTLELYLEYLNDEQKLSILLLSIEKGTMYSGKDLITICEYFSEEKYFIQILRALMEKKAVFNTKELLDLLEVLSDSEFSNQLVEYVWKSGVTFSSGEIQDLEEYSIDSDLVNSIRMNYLKNDGAISSDEVCTALETSRSEEEADQIILSAMKHGEHFTLQQYHDLEYAFSEETKGKFLAYILDKGEPLSVADVIEVVENDEDRPTAVIMVRALDRGLQFTFPQFLDISDYLNDFMKRRLLENVLAGNGRISKDDIREVIELGDEKMSTMVLEKAISQGMVLSAEDVMDFCEGVDEQKDCDRVILYALSRGTVLSPEQIYDLSCSASESVLTEAVRRIPRKLTRDELEDLDGVVDERLLRAIDKKQKTHVFDEDEYDDSYDYSDVGGKSHPLMTLLAVDFMLDELEKRRKRPK